MEVTYVLVISFRATMSFTFRTPAYAIGVSPSRNAQRAVEQQVLAGKQVVQSSFWLLINTDHPGCCTRLYTQHGHRKGELCQGMKCDMRRAARDRPSPGYMYKRAS